MSKTQPDDTAASVTAPTLRRVQPSEPPTGEGRSHGFVSIQGRGTIAIPRQVRERFNLDAPGAQLELIERPNGVLELRAMMAIPASEAWFWKDEWQLGERQVDEDYAHGRSTSFDNVDDFVAHLDGLSDQ